MLQKVIVVHLCLTTDQASPNELKIPLNKLPRFQSEKCIESNRFTSQLVFFDCFFRNPLHLLVRMNDNPIFNAYGSQFC